MAEVFRTVKGRKLDDYVVQLPGTAAAMRGYAFELESYAEVVLEAARDFSLMIGRPFEENVKVKANKENRTDWAVWLDDTGNSRQNAAGNIEFGRNDYFNDKGMPYGGMAGLEVLSQAIRIFKDRHRRSLRG